MPKLENFSSYLKIDGNPYNKNGLIYRLSGDYVSLYYSGKDAERVVEKAVGNFSKWTDSSDNAYTTVALLIADLDSFLFQTTVSLLEISREQIPSQGTDLLFGFNGTISTSWVDIHPSGGDINWLTVAGKVAISSSDAADTAEGLGVRSVEFHGLSATGVDQKETIATNGTTEVESTLDYIRETKMHSEDCGTYGGSHQGDITARVASGGAKTGAILAKMTGQEGDVDTSVQYGSGEANGGHWSVPLGKVAYLIGGEVLINTTGTKTADIILYEREGILITSAPFLPRRELWGAAEVQGVIPIEFRQLQKIKQLTDIWFRAKGSGSGTKIEVSLYFYVLDENADGA